MKKRGLYPNFSKHGLPRAMKLGVGIQDSRSRTGRSQSMGKSPFCSHPTVISGMQHPKGTSPPAPQTAQRRHQPRKLTQVTFWSQD